MSRPALDTDSAALHMRRRDINRPSRANDGGTSAVPGGKPKMPGDLTPEQEKQFKQLVKLLRRRRTVTPGDAPIIELYVRTHSHWVAACKFVDERGPMIQETRYSQAGTPYTLDIPNPALKLAASLASQLESLLKEMGLTGISREKVRVVKSAGKVPPEPGTVGWFKEQTAQSLALLPDIEIEEEVVAEESENEKTL